MALTQSARKNMKGISDNAQAMIDNFRKEGSREFSMEDFEDLIDAGDTDEKMFLAEIFSYNILKIPLPYKIAFVNNPFTNLRFPVLFNFYTFINFL